ncbi:MAG: hypothetical protein RIS21_22 [Planctomycetota bacterium]|jgi:Skp family chaperone for outer membrane proteins
MNRFAVLCLVAFTTLSASLEAQIGFIDFQKCFEEYKKADAQIKEQEKLLEAEKAKIRIAEGKIVSMRDNLDLLTDGSPDQLDLKKKIEVAKVDLSIDKELIAMNYQRMLVELLKKVYDDIRREVKAVAQEKGLKMVLLHTSGEIGGRTRQEVINNILVRPVFYFDPSLDITAEVVARLNK